MPYFREFSEIVMALILIYSIGVFVVLPGFFSFILLQYKGHDSHE